MPRHGHFSLWLVDTLARLCDGWLVPGSEAEPPALRGWRRTRLDAAPLTTRGIDWPQLKALTGAGAQAIGLSTLERPEEVQAVLQHGALAAAGDAAGIERATGLRTSGARLQRVVASVCAQAASDAMLNAAGVVELQARLNGTAGDAPPRELAVSAPPRPNARPNARGLLPFDAGQAGGASSAAAVVEPAALPPPRQEDEEMDKGGEGGDGGEGSEGGDGGEGSEGGDGGEGSEGGDGGEGSEGGDGGEGGEGSEGGECLDGFECTCELRYCRCPRYLAASKKERRRFNKKIHMAKRRREQVCTDCLKPLQNLYTLNSLLASLGRRI
jgi:hypothetical protein